MSNVKWDPKAREFLRKLPKPIAKRIFHKVDNEIRSDVQRHLESIVGKDYKKIRVGNYRLFVDFDQKEDLLSIRTIKHRKDAYKR